jgi:hypothetical protein
MFGVTDLAVHILDQRKQPLTPCSGKRARLLVERCRAVIHRRHPFTIRLKVRTGEEVRPGRVKPDPGSGTTGITMTREEDGNKGTAIVRFGEPARRGGQIGGALKARRPFRRRRQFDSARPGFGDRVRAALLRGTHAGIRVGRVALRATGSCRAGNADRNNAEHCRLLHRADGYGYGRRPALPPASEIAGFQRGVLP